MISERSPIAAGSRCAALAPPAAQPAADQLAACGTAAAAASVRWLPSIRHGSDRWWLPLSLQSADALAAALLAKRSGRDATAAIAAQLRIDPPLLIYAALATGLSERSPAADVTIAELAQILCRELTALLSSGDAALAVPGGGAQPATAADERVVTYQRLSQRYLNLAVSQWLAGGAEWLELAGPPVPAKWQSAWPRIVEPPAMAAPEPAELCFAASQLDLPALARTLRRGESLQQTFDDQLRQAKRSALKEFAYGLSHEINNPLANISTRAQTLMRAEPDPSRRQSLQRMIDQAMRAHEMVADLMFYAHPPTPQMRCTELHEVLQTVVNPSRSAVEGRGIEMVISTEPSVTLLADRAMLIEAVRALVRNAIEAIGCDGRIVLSASVQPSAPPTAGEPGAEPRPGTGDSQPVALITVCDSGPGLSEAAAAHAFDPYFSGREAGRGLGVGLCRVERIARLHGGDVSLHSGPVGCTARLWIPLRT